MRSIVRHDSPQVPVQVLAHDLTQLPALSPARRWLWLWLLVMLTMPAVSHSAAPVHLLGFVERLCADEPYCFYLRVEPEFVAQVGEHIKVRFATVSRIYNPENYELTLAQQNIVTGSHLRMLINADNGVNATEYQANFIWIGD